MTEHESEELFEELRRKLQDYGSHPSADVWQGIRQQLPLMPPIPPAPHPALRSRRHRWLAALLLLLIGVVSTVLLVQPFGTKQEIAGQPAKPKERSSKSVFTPKNQQQAASSASVGSDRTVAGVVALPQAPQPASATAARAASPNAIQEPAGSPETASLVTPTNRMPHRKRRSALLAAASVPSATQPTSGVAPKKSVASVRASSRSAATKSSIYSSEALITSGSTTSRVLPAVRNAPAAVGPQPPVGSPAEALGIGTAMKTGGALVAATHSSGSSEPGGQSYSASAALAQTGMISFLLLRPVPVQRQLPDNPVVQPVVLDSVVPRRPSRWALEVLAGPTLSYRRLGTDSANSIIQYERPAVAFSAQVQARYTLTPRLYLTGGVGYTTYSTQLDLVLRQRQRDSAATTVDRAVKQRDVYRYFTVPVQVQYQLQSWSRLQYGVMGGASLDVYAGGQTSGSTPCTCEQQQSWSATGSPYRRLGLSLSAGLDMRYALTPRLTLLVQPTGRYSVLSISDNNNSTALPARHPFAVGLLTGVSFNLR